MRRRVFALLFAALLALVIAPAVATALPRSGGSFGGRSGFRMSPGAKLPRSYSTGRNSYGGGNHFFFFPGFGWGGGYGGGGSGLFGTLLLLGLVGFGTVMVVRAVRRAQARGGWAGAFGQQDDDDDNVEALPGRAYVYKIQLGLGRSARDIQNRLARFAAEGDTATEAGLAQLLQQTTLELLRAKDSIRYGSLDASGPMSLTNGETKMNAASLSERSRFQVERVRGADGNVRRSDVAAKESDEALEYIVVTLVVATRTAAIQQKGMTDIGELQALLGQLGTVPAGALLGLEVIWTPADQEDALTTSDLLTGYPELRSF
jgi:uncharacterized membrane protein